MNKIILESTHNGWFEIETYVVRDDNLITFENDPIYPFEYYVKGSDITKYPIVNNNKRYYKVKVKELEIYEK